MYLKADKRPEGVLSGNGWRLLAVLAVLNFLVASCSAPEPTKLEKKRPLYGPREKPQAEPTEADTESEEEDEESEDNAPARAVREAPTRAPSAFIDPPAPTAADSLRARIRDFPSEDDLAYNWTINGTPIDNNSPALPKGNFKKGDRIGLTVRGGGTEASVEISIANRPPVFKKIGAEVRVGNQMRVDVEGSDPDGDTIRLEMPGITPGVTVSDMSIFIDPSVIGGKQQSIPIGLTDGEDSAGFLYNVRARATK